MIKRFDILFGFINRFNFVFSVSRTPFSREEETGVTAMETKMNVRIMKLTRNTHGKRKLILKSV